MGEEISNYESGLSALDSEDYEVALASFRAAYKQNRNDADILYALGYTYLYMESYEQAVRHLSQCLEVNPNHPLARGMLGEAQMELGKYRSALRTFHDYFSDVQLPYFLNKAAATYSRQGKHDLAAALYAASAVIEPANPTAYNNLAVSLNKVGRHADAVTACRRGLRIEPGDCYLTINLAESLRQCGRPKVALKILLSATEPCSREYTALIAIGNAYCDLGKYDDGITKFEEASGINPGSTTAYMNLGIAYDSMARLLDGERAFRHALTIDPEDAAVHNNLGANLELQGKAAEAHREFEIAAQLEPSNKLYKQNSKSGTATGQEVKR